MDTTVVKIEAASAQQEDFFDLNFPDMQLRNQAMISWQAINGTPYNRFISKYSASSPSESPVTLIEGDAFRIKLPVVYNGSDLLIDMLVIMRRKDDCLIPWRLI